VTIEETGEEERIWTSFGSADWSEQIDLDLTAPATRSLVTEWLAFFAARGVRIVRLDAVGYVIKKPGTSCFMVEPEIYEFLDWATDVAGAMGLAVLPEVHDVLATHRRLSAHGYWTYDFVLPALLLTTLRSGSVKRLAAHLEQSPARQFTMLDCHDGIPVRPDLDGILSSDEMRSLAEQISARGGNFNRILSDAHAVGVDVHQLNCTYFSALDEDDERYVAARAIQLFARGVPQVYYVGLLAGTNDHSAVELLGEGRAINRHNYSPAEVEDALRQPIVRRIVDLVRLRMAHPAFEGQLSVESGSDSAILLRWECGESRLALDVDLGRGTVALIDDGRREVIAEWLP
jgi:sucrose phosphorylase